VEIIASCFVVLVVSVAAPAEERPAYVEEIVVEGEAVAETATVNIVTAADIEKRGARNVAEALELVPGMVIRVGGKGEAYARVRGFRQREVAVLMDGFVLTAPYDGQLDLAALPVDGIDRIEVVKGASSLLYGANAMGGVINIITKKNDGTPRQTFRGSYGTGDRLDLSAVLEGPVGSARCLFVAGTVDRDAYPLSSDYEDQPNQDSGDRENSDRRGWNARLSLGWDIGQTGQASLNFGHVDLEKGMPHHEFDPKAKYWRFNDWRRSSLDFTYDKEIGRDSLKVKAYYDTFDNVLDGYDDRTYTTQDSKQAFHSSFDDYTLGADFFYRWRPTDHHLLKFGARPRRDVHKEQGDRDEPWERYEADVVSLPFEGEWFPNGKVTLTYGVSYDLMSFDRPEGGSETVDAFNPQIAALFQVHDKVRLRASASRKTRFPTLKELYSGRSGNPDLEPMEADIFELGADWDPRRDLSLYLVFFHNDIDNLIDRVRRDDPYLNVDRAQFKGLEAGLAWRHTERAVVSLDYTHLDAKDKSREGNQYIQYRPRHKLDLVASFFFPRMWDLTLTGSYVGSQYTDVDDIREMLDPYTLFGLRFSKRFQKGWEIFAQVHNLTDELYYESEGFPMEGRTVCAGLRFVH